MKELTFKKEENKWYIDIPWDGDRSDLEMVEGADVLLEALSEGLDFVTINISLEPFEDATRLTLIKSDDIGAHYGVENLHLNNVPYLDDLGKIQFSSTLQQFFNNPTIWLCNVTLHVLGSFPNEIYFKKVVKPNSEVLLNYIIDKCKSKEFKKGLIYNRSTDAFIGPQIEVASMNGYEGEGEDVQLVIYFKKWNTYIAFSGYYSSFSGLDWDGSIIEVFPKQKTITYFVDATNNEYGYNGGAYNI